MKLNLQKLPLKGMSPYSGKYLGREISSGKLSAKIEARLKGDNVEGTNQFVMHRLSLGKSVPSDSAPGVPLDNVLAIMRDGNGDITFDIPVSGKSSDPSFRYMRLLGKTFRKSLIDIATSPLTLLGSVYDWSGGSLDSIDFSPGSTELTSAQMEKLSIVARAMLEKSALELEISGASSPLEFAEKMDEEQLVKLATERAQNIKQFLSVQGVPNARLYLTENELSQSLKNEMIAAELELLSTDQDTSKSHSAETG